MPLKTLQIGVTGGIASGKSAVAGLFSDQGVSVVDADVIGHALVEPGQPALTAIAEGFGHELITPDGHLDRAALRRRVLADPDRREALEALLHPRILAAMRAAAAAAQSPYVLWVVPLLLEAGWQGEVDRILVIDLPTDVQRERLAGRDSLPADQVAAILARQWDRRRRLAAADDVIDNRGPPADLTAQVARLHAYYLSLVGDSDRPTG